VSWSAFDDDGCGDGESTGFEWQSESSHSGRLRSFGSFAVSEGRSD